MSVYKHFYIQQQRLVGSAYENIGPVVDSYETFHIACQETEYKYLPEIKELPVTNWHDEDGDDVYIPTDGTKIEAYDYSVDFLYVGSEATMNADIKGFINFLFGRNDGGSSLFCFYDEYTMIGRRCCYVKNIDNDLFIYNNSDDEVHAKFKLTIRVTDPTTDWEVGE